MEYLLPALHFHSVCVLCFEVGLLETTYIGVLFLYPFSLCLLVGAFNPFIFKVIDKYDLIAIYFIVLVSGLYALFVFPV